MKNIDFSFIILHYKTYNMTCICVHQILLLYKNKNIKIVIVDNGSKNKSGERLAKQFLSEDKVKVILSKKNLGFARGNNLGINYIKKHYSYKYIIVMNNDIILQEPEMLDKIKNIDKNSGFDVLGPDIYSLFTNTHQNPIRIHGYTLNQVKYLIIHHKKIQRFLPFYYCKKKFFNSSKSQSNDNKFNRNKDIINPVLHGAMYIFGDQFILNNKNIFNPRTFLYSEEDLLYCKCQKRNYKMMYSPSIRVIHLEHFSTNASLSSDYKRLKFTNYQKIKSLEILKDELEQQN